MRKYDFYASRLDEWIGDRSASILVVGAGFKDREVLRELGFKNVVLTDLDREVRPDPVDGFRVEYQNAEQLTYADESFDYVIANAMLHHCSSPHRALLEMYRVARKGVIAVEARDNVTMRLGIRLGLAMEYETGAVASHNGEYGGVNNTQVPNFIYRWTEREFRKTVDTFRPQYTHHFEFRHSADPGPIERLLARGGIYRIAGLLGRAAFFLATRLFPKQQNHLAMYVRKPTFADLKPWMKRGEGDQLVYDLSWRGHS